MTSADDARPTPRRRPAPGRSRVAVLAVATLVALAAPAATGIALAATSSPTPAATSGPKVGKPTGSSPRVVPGGPDAPDMISTGVGITPQLIKPEVLTGNTLAMLDPSGDSVVTSTPFPNEGTYVLDKLAGTITFTPVYGFSGTPIALHLMSYRITDSTSGKFGVGLYTPTVTKPAGPSAPALTSTGLVNTPQSAAPPPAGAGSRVDLLLGTAVQSQGTVNVDGEGTYVVDHTSGLMTFYPVMDVSGDTAGVHYRITDGYGTFADSTYTPTVLPPAPPVAVALTSSQPSPVEHVVPVTLPTGGWLTLPEGPTASVSLPGMGTYSVVGSTLHFKPLPDFVGVAGAVTYRLTDAYGQTAENTYIATVTAPPVLVDGFTGVVPVATPVTAPSPTGGAGTGVLPVTGFDVTRLAGLALLLLVTGIATTALSHRRPRR